MPAVFAQSDGVDIGSSWPLARVTEFQSLGALVSYFLPKILLLGSVVFFILIIIAGFGMISSAGSDDAHTKEQAKNFLTYALLGLIIMFGSYWILQIINFITQGALNSIL